MSSRSRWSCRQYQRHELVACRRGPEQRPTSSAARDALHTAGREHPAAHLEHLLLRAYPAELPCRPPRPVARTRLEGSKALFTSKVVVR